MVKIVIENMARKEVNGKAGSSVLSLLHENLVDWMHACGGKGRCTTCKMVVVSGAEALGPLTDGEQRYRANNELGVNERLACQAKIINNCRVRVPDEYKLPHLNYTE